jgi:peptidoglycan/LPS O-acetylase OafA/YrhL
MLKTATEIPPKPTAVAVQTGGRLPELDGLRGIAIALVVLYHCLYYAPPSTYHPANIIQHLYLWFERFIAIGWTGVDLFFVLSGFLIGGILLDARESTRYWRTFYLRRFFRIIPVYYAWIAAYVAVVAVAGSFLNSHIGNGGPPAGAISFE